MCCIQTSAASMWADLLTLNIVGFPYVNKRDCVNQFIFASRKHNYAVSTQMQHHVIAIR